MDTIHESFLIEMKAIISNSDITLQQNFQLSKFVSTASSLAWLHVYLAIKCSLRKVQPGQCMESCVMKQLVEHTMNGLNKELDYLKGHYFALS